MKRDRIQQEVYEASRHNRTLEASPSLSAANKRIAQLQGAEARPPTAMNVCSTYFPFRFNNYLLLFVVLQQVYQVLEKNILIVRDRFHHRPSLCICRYKRTERQA